MERSVKRWRSVLAACCAAVFMLAVGACASPHCDAGGSRTLTIAWWGSQDRNNRQRQVNDLFAAAHPGVRIDGQFSQYGDYWQKLATSAAGNQMPDIVAMDLPYLTRYADRGLLLDLEPFIRHGDLDLSHVPASVVDAGRTQEGKLIALSAGSNAPALIYDKTLLDSLGIAIPERWTLGAFIRVCREVYRRSGVKTNAGYYRDATMLAYLLRGEGVTLFDGGGLNVGDGSTLRQYFAMFQTGIEEGWHLDPTVFAEINLSVTNSDPLVSYSDNTRRSWCNFGWSNSLASLQSLVPGHELALVPWPSDDVERSNYVHPAQFFAITKDCDDPQLAAQWIDFVTNNAQAVSIMGIDRGVPSNGQLAESIENDLSAPDLLAVSYVRDVAVHGSPIGPPDPQRAVRVTMDIMPHMQERVLYRNIDADQAAREFTEQSRAALGMDEP